MAEQKLHPDAQQVCDLIVASGRPPIETLSPPEARVAYPRVARPILQPDPEPVAEVLALEADGPAGPIPLRLYRGQGVDKGRPQPALIYFHGGGWVIGDLESHDQVCRALANAIPVHRRLRRLPAGARAQVSGRRRGCHRRHALDRRQRGAARHRCRPRSRSAATAPAATSPPSSRSMRATAAARGSPSSSSIYPGTDMRMGWPSLERHAQQLPLTRAGMHWFIAHYLREPGGQDRLARLAAAGVEPAGLPPALVVTAGFDPLCDEGEAYAEALRKAGVAVAHERFEGQIHGFRHHGAHHGGCRGGPFHAAAASRSGSAFARSLSAAVILGTDANRQAATRRAMLAATVPDKAHGLPRSLRSQAGAFPASVRRRESGIGFNSPGTR